MRVLGYSIPELQEFIYFAKERDVDKLITKIAVLQNELSTLVSEDCEHNMDSAMVCIKCGYPYREQD